MFTKENTPYKNNYANRYKLDQEESKIKDP